MQKFKYYSIWISFVLVFVFILQNLFSIDKFFILNQLSYTQPYRFITSMFLHGSITHLLSNIFALIFFGLALEKLIGSNKFLFVYLASGIFANIISINFYSSSLGASGAIMGIIGALTIIRPMLNVWAFSMIIPMFVAAIIWIIVDTIGLFIPSNIGHIAHISGIIIGLIFGIFFRIKNPPIKTHKVKVPEHMLRRWETLYMGG